MNKTETPETINKMNDQKSTVIRMEMIDLFLKYHAINWLIGNCTKLNHIFCYSPLYGLNLLWILQIF